MHVATALAGAAHAVHDEAPQDSGLALDTHAPAQT